MIDKAVKNLFDAIVDEKLQLSVEQQLYVALEPRYVALPSVHEFKHPL
jgi:hypothetical protein